jgi:hypothetical protein
MGFNEKTHAFIAAKFYVHLTEHFGERGKAAFTHAVRYYAEQRGRRMAQRAIRDGQPLNYETYCRYGEWKNTKDVEELGCSNQVTVESYGPDYVMQIHRCPWHTQFKEMGLKDAGLAYCSVLDASICRGFNPNMVYEVPQTLHDHDYCIQIIRDSGFEDGQAVEKRPEGIRPFEYHCGHSYWSFSEVSAAIFGAEGETVNLEVMEDFKNEYGEEMAGILAGYRNTNFNVC